MNFSCLRLVTEPCFILCFLKFAGEQQLESPHEERVSNALHSVEVELQKLTEIPWLYYILHPNEDAVCEMWPVSL